MTSDSPRTSRPASRAATAKLDEIKFQTGFRVDPVVVEHNKLEDIVTRALEAVALQLLDGHLRHCVTEAAAAGEPDVQAKVTEATEAIRRLVRS